MRKITCFLWISIFMLSTMSTLYAAMNMAPTFKGRILVFSKTAAFRHSAIAVGKIALMKISRDMGLEADTTEDATIFNELSTLKKYKAIVFLQTTGDILNDQQSVNFQQYIRAGGGFVGIHAASDTEYEWPWYGALVGGYFADHPAIQQANLNVLDTQHRSTRHLPTTWTRTDEWYNFKKLDPSIHVLMTIDESTYKGGKNGAAHPMCWYHLFDGGKAWYTALGHTEASYEDPMFLGHLRGGLEWVM